MIDDEARIQALTAEMSLHEGASLINLCPG